MPLHAAVPYRSPHRQALALALLAFCAAAHAQGVPVFKKTLPLPKLAISTGTWSQADAAANGLSDEGNAGNQPALSQVVALRGFLMAFGNGDHKIRRIGVRPDGRFTRFSFADSNGDDPFRANASYATFSQGSIGEVTATGGGKFAIKLPTPPQPGHTLVLRGFEFRRTDGTDANLRNISVWLDGARNLAEVSLTDDQGMDFRGLERTLGLAMAAGATMLPGLMEAATASAAPVVGRNIPSMVGKYRGYQVTVQYAWIPSGLVLQEGAVAGGGGDLDSPRIGSSIDALQGFEFTFNNSDHHLLSLAVNGEHRGRRIFSFQDNNRDDPLQWTVTYVTLDPARRK